MTRSFFGTDGIRGRVGEVPMVPEMVLKLGWACGKILSQGQPGKQVLIGKDTRISGYLLESALESGLAAAGMNVLLVGPLPTPGIAYLTRKLGLDAGIVVSASHNPYHDNGIKFFNHEGKKLPDPVEIAIEELLSSTTNIQTVEPQHLGRAKHLGRAQQEYIDFCVNSFGSDISASGLKIVLDCANGAGYKVGPAILDKLGCNFISLGVEPDGLNINENCGSTNTKLLQDAVVEHQADLGIAIDGDGDRVILVDAQGQIVDGDQILYILALDYQRRNCLNGGVVGTVMSNLGLEYALKSRNIEFMRTKVGDKYVLAELEQRAWCLGGEVSGHVICLDKVTSGDGLFSAVQILRIMIQEQKALAELATGFYKYPQSMININFKSSAIDPISHPKVTAAVEEISANLAERGRVLLRKSGTEPVLRVMVEGEDPLQVERLAQQLAECVRNSLNYD